MKFGDDGEETLDDDLWKDSFDRLLDKRSLLRELSIVKKNVRTSYNNNSSVQDSMNKLSGHISVEHDASSRRLRKKTDSISTPNENKLAHLPFDCPLSPISSWYMTQSSTEESLKSTPNRRVCPLQKDYFRRSTPTSQNSRTDHYYDKNSLLLKRKSPIQENGADVTNIKETQSSKCEYLEPDVNFILPPGKWRKSLTVWKRLNNIKCDYSSTNNQPFTRDNKYQKQLLDICRQSNILHFTEIYSDTLLRQCRKIGEGTYGEVFLFSHGSDETVLKIIPIEGEQHINGEPQKKIYQVLPEVIITRELSNLRITKSYRTSGFAHLKNVRCVKGYYPSYLIELWNIYEKNYGSENDHPEIFTENQIYLVFEIDYGGKDLEKFPFKNSEQAYSVYLQILFSLAIAERSLEFEHRDLHCGNILIQQTNEPHIEYKFNNEHFNIPTNGVKATIIDYTLSRIYFEGCHYFNDLSADEELFLAKGDYQFDIYRMMRTKLRNDWMTFEPKTNVMWLHFILTKLSSVKYKNPRSKRHVLFMDRLKKSRDSIFNHNCAFDIIENHDVFCLAH